MDALYRVALRIAYRLARVYWFLLRPRTEGAHVAVWQAGRVLLIRNSYRNVAGFPAGGLRRGERPIDGAVRELREEVGIQVDPSRLRFVRTIASCEEYKKDRSHFFELHVSEEASPVPDGREVIWAGFVTPEEALRGSFCKTARIYLESAAAPSRDPQAPSSS